MPREELCLLGGEPGVAVAQALRELREGLIALEARRAAQLLKPARIALRRLLGPCRRHAEPLEVREPRHTRGTYAGIQRSDVSAQAMADEVQRLYLLYLAQQKIEVGDV